MTTENVTATSRRERHRATKREVENFRVIAEALGADRETAGTRAMALADQRPDLGNAEVFILVLREIADITRGSSASTGGGSR